MSHQSFPTPHPTPSSRYLVRELDRTAIVGAGRLGTALGASLRAAGLDVDGPLARGERPSAEATLVLLAVPDGAIAEAAAAVDRGPLVGHCSGATTLEPLLAAGHHRACSLHPLMTVPAGAPSSFDGAGAAVAGTDAEALAAMTALAGHLGMRPVTVEDADRAAYHAAASMASNFLVTIESAAERVAATAGVGRDLLVPLVRAAVDNWAALGPAALTGPIARGDEATVARHRQALRERTPDLIGLYDALAEATRA
jgi:predicted short-subunit dehydrogenase-like oxidoreductase (DUF2520 family)